MSQRVLAHYAWPNDLGLTLGIHMVEEENTLIGYPLKACMCIHTK